MQLDLLPSLKSSARKTKVEVRVSLGRLVRYGKGLQSRSGSEHRKFCSVSCLVFYLTATHHIISSLKEGLSLVQSFGDSTIQLTPTPFYAACLFEPWVVAYSTRIFELFMDADGTHRHTRARSRSSHG